VTGVNYYALTGPAHEVGETIETVLTGPPPPPSEVPFSNLPYRAKASDQDTMANPGGKRGKFRRPFPTDKTPGDLRPAPAEVSERQGPPTETVSCERCKLPILGDRVSMVLRSKRSSRQLFLCEPCGKSYLRWTKSSEASPTPTRTRRKKQTEIVDSLISRRKSNVARRMDRLFGEDRGRTLLALGLAVLIGVGLIGIVTSVIMLWGGTRQS
jgi:hypothetical protein